MARVRERIRLVERAELQQHNMRDAQQAQREADACAQRAAAMRARADELRAELEVSDDDDAASDVITRPMDAD